MLLPLIFGGLALLGIASASKGTSGGSATPGLNDLAAWANDLAELPDDPPGAGLRSEVVQWLSNSTPQDIPMLNQLANGLAPNFPNAARRIRARIKDLGGI